MKKSNLFLLLAVLIGAAANAQQSFSTYHTQSLPQRSSLNAALRPDCKWYIGMPGLSNLGVQYTNSGFNLRSLSGVLANRPADTSVVVDLNRLVDVFNKVNYIGVKADQTWLSFGFKAGKHFFNAHIAEKISVKFGYPKDLFSFLIEGNGGPNLGRNFDLRFSLDALHYREYALGYSYNLHKNLIVGGRIKALQGINLVELKNTGFQITTRPEDYAYVITSDVELNTSSALFPLIPTSDSANQDFNAQNLFKGIRNKGFALDLGVEWKTQKKVTLSAGLNDFGYINWRQNNVSIVSKKQNEAFIFDGLHITSGDTATDVEGYFKNLGDTLLKKFGVDTISRNFRTTLSTELFFGASVELRKNLHLNGLVYADFYNRRFYPGVTIGLYYRPFKMLSFNITNNFYNRALFNPGLTAVANLGAVQMFLNTENLIAPVLFDRTRNVSVRFGINLTFGREKSRGEAMNGGSSGGTGLETDPNTVH